MAASSRFIGLWGWMWGVATTLINVCDDSKTYWKSWNMWWYTMRLKHLNWRGEKKKKQHVILQDRIEVLLIVLLYCAVHVCLPVRARTRVYLCVYGSMPWCRCVVHHQPCWLSSVTQLLFCFFLFLSFQCRSVQLTISLLWLFSCNFPCIDSFLFVLVLVLVQSAFLKKKRSIFKDDESFCYRCSARGGSHSLWCSAEGQGMRGLH